MTTTALTIAAVSALALTAGASTALRPDAPTLVAGPAGPAGTAGPAWSQPPSAAPAPRWSWPLAPRPRVVRPFRLPDSPWGRGHRGVDLEAAPGASVLAVEGGIVTHAARLAGRGTVTVAHPDGVRSTYEPVEPTVVAGDRVAVGDLLGHLAGSGPGHCPQVDCLHLGAIRSGYLDPMSLLAGGRVRLLPLEGLETGAGLEAVVSRSASPVTVPPARAPPRSGRVGRSGGLRCGSSRRRPPRR